MAAETRGRGTQGWDRGLGRAGGGQGLSLKWEEGKESMHRCCGLDSVPLPQFHMFISPNP